MCGIRTHGSRQGHHRTDRSCYGFIQVKAALAQCCFQLGPGGRSSRKHHLEPEQRPPPTQKDLSTFDSTLFLSAILNLASSNFRPARPAGNVQEQWKERKLWHCPAASCARLVDASCWILPSSCPELKLMAGRLTEIQASQTLLVGGCR